MSRVIVTCGPSYEPIDQVRRITNFSTGELGLLLANALTAAGHEVLCCKGAAATCHLPLERAELVTFTTNDDLRTRLHSVAEPGSITAFFHAAALADFRVKGAAFADCTPLSAAKISSRAGELTLTLEPAAKLISELRTLFPRSKIVGWKYELDGSREEAISRARQQIAESRTDACVVNGAAFGDGFGWCEWDSEVVPLASKTNLCTWLVQWLDGRESTAKARPAPSS